MARSGETLMLRVLDAHPRLRSVIQIEREQRDYENRLFDLLRTWPHRTLPGDHPLLRPYQLDSSEILVLKQGIWEHEHPFWGFVLVRNPVSVFASLDEWDHLTTHPDGPLAWARERAGGRGRRPNTGRYRRWLASIDTALAESIVHCDPVEQFCAFYNRRMAPLADLGLPVVHYERLVQAPRRVLGDLLGQLEIPYTDDLLESHRRFEPGRKGHGTIDLGKPISTASLHKYQRVGRRVFHRIRALTAATWRRYGYTLEWDDIQVSWERLR